MNKNRKSRLSTANTQTAEDKLKNCNTAFTSLKTLYHNGDDLSTVRAVRNFAERRLAKQGFLNGGAV